MPKTEVLLFAEDDGSSPFVDWLTGLPTKVQIKSIARVERLIEFGHELRRPEADFLRDGIHELRLRHGRVNYRILYFFHEQRIVVSHGLTKEAAVPNSEIDLAIERQATFEQHPDKHTYKG